MNRKREPKNKNITVRVTNKKHFEFTEIAQSNNLSVSEWANNILTNHKDSYGKIENQKLLVKAAELSLRQMKKVCQVLDIIKFQYPDCLERIPQLIHLKANLPYDIEKMESIKRRLINNK